MALKLKQSELNKILKKTGGEPQKKQRNNSDRLEDAISLLKELKTDDKIYFNEDSTKCMLEFSNVLIISMNDSLRLGARRMSEYKSLWHNRVEKLVKKEVLKRWKNSKEEKILIEFLYESKTKAFMDYDGRMGAFKAPLDGLTESGMIYDDSQEHIPIILGMQTKSPTGKPNLKIILSVEKNPDRFYSNEFLEIIKQK